MGHRISVAALLTLLCATSAHAELDAANKTLAHDLFKELIEINTTESGNGSTPAAEAMAKRLLDAGFAQSDVQVLGPNERKKNLIVRFRGTGKHKPVLLIGHLDVVEAKREDWTTDPFELVEKDGFFYGRGTIDMKDGDAIMVATLIRLKKEGFRPARDIILALTADEEGSDDNGVDWLLKNHRDLVDAEFVINHDGWSVISEHGKPLFFEMDATEKVYADFQLITTSKGGHSSMPVPDNAIYELTDGLQKISKYEFPIELNSVTRSYYERMSKIEAGERGADMKALLATPPDAQAAARLSKDAFDHSVMRTTCVATMLSGGHAANALPQRASANVNCRILPGHSPEEVRQALVKVVANPDISVRYVQISGELTDTASNDKGYPPPPMKPEIMQPLERVVKKFWPGLEVVPTMSTGASDGTYTNVVGMPTYVIAGIALDRDNFRAHGKDERVGVDSYYRGAEFFHDYLKELTAR
jgi:acetylornithine deacetylase/succinyl-diaminopimelate desuccinylase-like protein